LLFTLHALLDPTKRPDLLVLDEVDKGLDEKGVASLMALVNEVRMQYGTVIMTSHRTEISGADFDRVWRVTKVNEESSLSLAS
jgi:ABC-type Mn2+/Zn2+ transport system ATPase subunit